MEAKDFVNTPYERYVKEIEAVEKEHNFDKALKLAKRYLRCYVVCEKRGRQWGHIDHSFIHWLNPYER